MKKLRKNAQFLISQYTKLIQQYTKLIRQYTKLIKNILIFFIG